MTKEFIIGLLLTFGTAATIRDCGAIQDHSGRKHTLDHVGHSQSTTTLHSHSAEDSSTSEENSSDESGGMDDESFSDTHSSNYDPDFSLDDSEENSSDESGGTDDESSSDTYSSDYGPDFSLDDSENLWNHNWLGWASVSEGVPSSSEENQGFAPAASSDLANFSENDLQEQNEHGTNESAQNWANDDYLDTTHNNSPYLEPMHGVNNLVNSDGALITMASYQCLGWSFSPSTLSADTVTAWLSQYGIEHGLGELLSFPISFSNTDTGSDQYAIWNNFTGGVPVNVKVVLKDMGHGLRKKVYKGYLDDLSRPHGWGQLYNPAAGEMIYSGYWDNGVPTMDPTPAPAPAASASASAEPENMDN